MRIQLLILRWAISIHECNGLAFRTGDKIMSILYLVTGKNQCRFESLWLVGDISTMRL